MLLHCPTSTGKILCNTTRDHKLKVEGNIAVCMTCGEDNLSVSDFMKSAMKSSGDLYRSIAARKAFMYKCPKCSIDRGVKIIEDKAFCDTCLHPLNLAGPTIEAIKTTPNSTKDGIEDKVEPKETLVKGVVKRRKS